MKLPYLLASLDKLKTQKEINLWIKKYNDIDSYVVSDKLDGMSCLYYNGLLASRGDGSTG